MNQNTGGCCSAKSSPLPEVTFSTFILSLASSTLVQLGEVPNPETNRVEQDLAMARHSIDILNMLRQKTECSLEDQERKMLDSILYELQMKYVIKCKNAPKDTAS
jgi:hypothetical protein